MYIYVNRCSRCVLKLERLSKALMLNCHTVNISPRIKTLYLCRKLQPMMMRNSLFIEETRIEIKILWQQGVVVVVVVVVYLYSASRSASNALIVP